MSTGPTAAQKAEAATLRQAFVDQNGAVAGQEALAVRDARTAARRAIAQAAALSRAVAPPPAGVPRRP